LDKGFSHYLVLLLNPVTLAGQGLQDLDAFALRTSPTKKKSKKSLLRSGESFALIEITGEGIS
jgi:hypothetical protein